MRKRSKAPAYTGSGKLHGKVAIITGADSGIGRAVATLFAREGANIVGTYLPAEKSDAQKSVAGITRKGGEGAFLSGDVANSAFAQKVVKKALQTFKRLDIVVNNAAYQHQHKELMDISDTDWDRTFKTNVYGYFYLTKAALPYLKPGSVIINTGPIASSEDSDELIDYATTKGAIHAFTKSLAQQLWPQGIRVNAISPGSLWTPLKPEEVAPAYVYFASNADSAHVTGEVLTLLGGQSVLQPV